MGVVLLAGGTGGAKLARGFELLVGDELAVVANTGDDVEMHGGLVSPDPDLITFWLAGRVDERGWGLRDDTFIVMEALEALGEEVWFRLGDRDLAVCLRRASRLRAGARATEVADELRRAFGARGRVLPMSDQPVRTHVRARDAWHEFQAFMIREGGAGPVDDVHFNGAAAAAPTREVLESVAAADAIVVGPSNPVISIGPILAVPGLRDALRAACAPVVAVSPLVGGQVVKGPTEAFMAWAGVELGSNGICAHYGDLLDGLVADEPATLRPTLVCDVRLDDDEARVRVAERTLELARGLAA